MMKNRGRFLLWLSLAITWGLFGAAKIVGSGAPIDFWQFSSQFLALNGTMLLAITFLLSSRSKWVEKLFGSLDKVYKKHHLIGGVAFVMLIHHPLMLAIRTLIAKGNGLIYFIPSTNWPYTLGIATLYGLVVLLIFTLIINLPYNSWIKTHRLMGVVLIGAWWHIFLINSDVSRFWPLKLWMLGWVMLAGTAVIYRRWLIYRGGLKFEYIVGRTKKWGNVIEITLEAKGDKIKFEPGQFIFVSFKDKLVGNELHPFSIASAPEERELRLGIKMGGSYTNKLAELKPGSAAEIIGPYGEMYRSFLPAKKVVMIAGGIGITPFLGMLNQKKEKVLFYSIRERHGYADDKLAKMNIDNFRYFPVYSGEGQRITGSYVQEKIGDLKDRTFLICGPEGMMKEIEEQLVKLGVNKSDIYYENFYLR